MTIEQLKALTEAHKHSSNHRQEVLRSTLVGCFYCRRTSKPEEIHEWTDDDQCAICPKCMIDSVIGDASGLPVTEPAWLESMYQHWFNTLPAIVDYISSEQEDDED